MEPNWTRLRLVWSELNSIEFNIDDRFWLIAYYTNIIILLVKSIVGISEGNFVPLWPPFCEKFLTHENSFVLDNHFMEVYRFGGAKCD